MKQSSGYLPHVDGLRAVAVLSVVFYHYNVRGFSGGYVGVDIFFVISGYLITKIIETEIGETGTVRYQNFYKRRIRRLFPALVFTLATTALCAMLIFVPEDFVRFGKSMATAAMSVANFNFWLESGYFDASSHTKPLLHTWSLSVEEQFYLFWPAIMLLIWKLRSARVRAMTVVVLGVASLVLNHIFVHSGKTDYASTIFFLTPFRGYEFALGALGAIISDRWSGNAWIDEAMTVIGLTLIAATVFILTQNSVFPYINGLYPCVGSILVILGAARSKTGWLLRNRLMVWIGLISYSLYLAHWPILVFTKYLLLDPGTPLGMALMFIAALATAAFMYRFVESPFRYHSLEGGWDRFYLGNLALLLVATALGAAIYRSDGWVWRYTAVGPGLLGALVHPVAQTDPGSADLLPNVGRAEQVTNAPAWRAVFKPMSASEIEVGKARRFDLLRDACSIGELNNPKRCFLDRPIQILVFGNSHEPDAFNMFHALYGKSPNVNMIAFGTVNECDYRVADGNIEARTKTLNCDARFAMLNDRKFTDRLGFVVYGTHYGFDPVAAGLWDVLEVIASRNKKIRLIAIGTFIETTIECSSIYNRTGSLDGCKADRFVKYFNPHERTNSTVRQVKSMDYLYISKQELLCKSEKASSCVVHGGGEPAFYDSHHLSLGFSRFIGGLIARRYAGDLQAIGLPRPDPQ